MSHFPIGLEHCASTQTSVIGLTVIIGLVFSLEPTDGQGGRVARLGARESVGDPRGSIAITIGEEFGGRSWELLVPLHIVTPDVGAASSTGDGDTLSWGPRH